MSHNEAPPSPLALPLSSQSDIEEVEDLIESYPTTVIPPSPPRAFIPVSSATPPQPPSIPPPRGADTLTEPVVDTINRDLRRIVHNLKLVVFPNPNREDPGKALRDWDLWGPFFFIIFLGFMLSWSSPVQKSQVFAVAFAMLAAGAVILTLNVLLLIIFFQSLSLLGYCIAPLDVGAFICMLRPPVIVKVVVASVALGWSSWAAYPFISTAVNPQRKALALYPVLLMYVSLGFLIIAID